VAWLSLAVAFVCVAIIVVDEVRHPQAMAVMNLVWPITALYFSIFAVWAYFALGRSRSRLAMQQGKAHSHQEMHGAKEQGRGQAPDLAEAALGTSHCGAGCMLADVGTEFAIAASGLVSALQFSTLPSSRCSRR
jgi:hypothetical protein